MFLNRGDRLALVDFNDKKINYTELVNNVKYFSENVVTAGKDDFGLILMENRPEWIYTYFALWDRKAVPIALDSTSNGKEILYILEDSGPKFIICSDETEKNVKEAVSMYDRSLQGGRVAPWMRGRTHASAGGCASHGGGEVGMDS